MNAMAHLSDIIIPILIFFVVGYGYVSRVKVYESFLKGAKSGLRIVVDIVPTLIGLMMAVGMLRDWCWTFSRPPGRTLMRGC